MHVNNQQTADTIESLVDAHGLATVLDMLAEVCHAKAEHIEGNWQDDGSDWTRAASVIENAAAFNAIKTVQSVYGPQC